VTTPQFDIDTHIREAVDFEKGRVDYLPFEVKTPLIRAGWYAQEISKFFAGHDFNAMFPIGAKADQFVKRDGVFARHCVGNLAPNAPPSIGPAKHKAKPLGYSELHGCVIVVIFISVREFKQMRLHDASLARSRRHVSDLHLGTSQPPQAFSHAIITFMLRGGAP